MLQGQMVQMMKVTGADGRELSAGIADDPVAETENALREKTIAEGRETLSRLVALLDPKNGMSTARALLLIQQTAQSFSDLVSALGTGMIPNMIPRRAGVLGNAYSSNSGYGGLLPVGPQAPEETFGAQIATQFTSAIKQANAPQGIDHLVGALATAKEAGLTAEADLIQKKLRKLLGADEQPSGLVPAGLSTAPDGSGEGVGDDA